MEDENKILEIIKKFKWIIVGIIIIILLPILIFNSYNYIMINKNTKQFSSYLLNNGYENNHDGTYTKENINNNQTIIYIFSSKESILSKAITTLNENNKSDLLLKYQSNNIIEISLSISGKNNNNSYGTTIQTATYNTNNNKFKCKLIQNDGFNSKCNKMKKEAKFFKTEINNLLKKSNTKAKYIKKDN